MRFISRCALGLLVSTLLLPCLVAWDDMRTWSDATGKYTLEAKFIGIEGNKVVLEKADGSRVQIDLIKLKSEDRVEAMKLNAKKMRDNPFKQEDNPFKDTAKNSGRTRGGTKTEPGTEPNPTALTSIDWAGVKQLSVFGSEWKQPSLSSVDLKLNWQPRPVSFPSKDFFDKATGVVISPEIKRAAVVTVLEKPGSTTGGSSTIHWCNLEKGLVVKSYPMTGKQTPLALSADGTILVTREDVWGHNKSHVVTLWKISDDAATPTHRFDAAQDEKGHGNDVQGAVFLADGTLLTWLSGGLYTWWSTSDLKPLQTMQLQGNCTPALSHDRKLLATRSNNDLVILDAVTGDTLSVKTLSQGMISRLAFSPDGKKLATLALNKAEIYDLTTGNLANSISVSGFGHEAPCFWTSPTALLAGQPLAFLSPDMNVNVWGYDGTDKVAVAGDTGFFITKSQNFTLVPVKLPHSSALQLIEQARTDSNFFILKPGTTVRIDVSGISDPDLQQQAMDALTRKLQEAGHSVGSSDIVIAASIAKGKDHEVAYRTFPGFGLRPEKTHTVPGWTYLVKLVADGKTHWTMGGGNHPPPMIHLKENETIESHLKQYGVPSASFFKNLEMPKYVARAQSDQTTGSQSLRRSQITPNGIR